MKTTSEGQSGVGRGVFIAVVVVVIVIAGAAYFIFGLGAAKTSSTSSTISAATTTTISAATTTAVATSTLTSPTSTTTSSAQLVTVQVIMPNGVATSQSLNFQPAKISLVIGVNNTVMWTNKDAAPHTVTAMSVPSGATKFNSGNMNTGATFTYTFTVPGTYTYQCTYHYWMQGTIVVENAA